jgi:hypothetical protein
MNLTPEARQARDWALEKGIPVDTVEMIIETVLDQEVVSYCSEQGTVTFDYLDVVYEVIEH